MWYTLQWSILGWEGCGWLVRSGHSKTNKETLSCGGQLASHNTQLEEFVMAKSNAGGEARWRKWRHIYLRLDVQSVTWMVTKMQKPALVLTLMSMTPKQAIEWLWGLLFLSHQQFFSCRKMTVREDEQQVLTKDMFYGPQHIMLTMQGLVS